MGITTERYFVINKPYNMVSQFISPHKVNLLSDLGFDFPGGTHAIGRLDNNSEGLLLLTTNKKITRLLFNDTIAHERVYLVQVKNILSKENLEQLSLGVTIRIKGNENYLTPACKVRLATEQEIKHYSSIAAAQRPGLNTWLFITLTEGKYHQVRKMIAAVHHRCVRLIRVSIEDLLLDDLAPGTVKEIAEKEFFEKLKLKRLSGE